MAAGWIPRIGERGPFLEGVASGDPLGDRVVLWTRVTSDGPVEVDWVVASDPALREVVASGRAAAEPSADHTVKVDARGLEPGATYYYAFEAGGERSAVGRTKTLPLQCNHLRIGVTACAKYSAGHFNAYARVADRRDLDLWLHIGDYIYE